MLKTATLAGGWSNLQNQVLFKNKFDEKHDLKFDSFRVYNRLGTYYADMLKGNFQIGVGTWDSFAKMHMKGAPMQIIGIVSTGTLAGMFARKDGPNSLEELKGKTVAAMQVSGTFKMAKTWAKVFGKIDFDKDVRIQNAPNPPATINIVAADRADAAIAWEHSLSVGLHKIRARRSSSTSTTSTAAIRGAISPISASRSTARRSATCRPTPSRVRSGSTTTVSSGSWATRRSSRRSARR